MKQSHRLHLIIHYSDGKNFNGCKLIRQKLFSINFRLAIIVDVNVSIFSRQMFRLKISPHHNIVL